MLTKEKSKSDESYVYSGIELELAWSSLSLHLIGKRIKKILTQKHQYSVKYLSRFNDKNAFRKLKKSVYFSRFQLYT